MPASAKKSNSPLSRGGRLPFRDWTRRAALRPPAYLTDGFCAAADRSLERSMRNAATVLKSVRPGPPANAGLAARFMRDYKGALLLVYFHEHPRWRRSSSFAGISKSRPPFIMTTQHY